MSDARTTDSRALNAFLNVQIGPSRGTVYDFLKRRGFETRELDGIELYQLLDEIDPSDEVTKAREFFRETGTHRPFTLTPPTQSFKDAYEASRPGFEWRIVFPTWNIDFDHFISLRALVKRRIENIKSQRRDNRRRVSEWCVYVANMYVTESDAMKFLRMPLPLPTRTPRTMAEFGFNAQTILNSVADVLVTWDEFRKQIGAQYNVDALPISEDYFFAPQRDMTDVLGYPEFRTIMEILNERQRMIDNNLYEARLRLDEMQQVLPYLPTDLLRYDFRREILVLELKPFTDAISETWKNSSMTLRTPVMDYATSIGYLQRLVNHVDFRTINLPPTFPPTQVDMNRVQNSGLGQRLAGRIAGVAMLITAGNMGTFEGPIDVTDLVNKRNAVGRALGLNDLLEIARDKFVAEFLKQFKAHPLVSFDSIQMLDFAKRVIETGFTADLLKTIADPDGRYQMDLQVVKNARDDQARLKGYLANFMQLFDATVKPFSAKLIQQQYVFLYERTFRDFFSESVAPVIPDEMDVVYLDYNAPVDKVPKTSVLAILNDAEWNMRIAVEHEPVPSAGITKTKRARLDRIRLEGAGYAKRTDTQPGDDTVIPYVEAVEKFKEALSVNPMVVSEVKRLDELAAKYLGYKATINAFIAAAEECSTWLTRSRFVPSTFVAHSPMETVDLQAHLSSLSTVAAKFQAALGELEKYKNARDVIREVIVRDRHRQNMVRINDKYAMNARHHEDEIVRHKIDAVFEELESYFAAPLEASILTHALYFDGKFEVREFDESEIDTMVCFCSPDFDPAPFVAQRVEYRFPNPFDVDLDVPVVYSEFARVVVAEINRKYASTAYVAEKLQTIVSEETQTLENRDVVLNEARALVELLKNNAAAINPNDRVREYLAVWNQIAKRLFDLLDLEFYREIMSPFNEQTFEVDVYQMFSNSKPTWISPTETGYQITSREMRSSIPQSMNGCVDFTVRYEPENESPRDAFVLGNFFGKERTRVAAVAARSNLAPVRPDLQEFQRVRFDVRGAVNPDALALGLGVLNLG